VGGRRWRKLQNVFVVAILAADVRESGRMLQPGSMSLFPRCCAVSQHALANQKLGCFPGALRVLIEGHDSGSNLVI
jgi:hypothetical protein